MVETIVGRGASADLQLDDTFVSSVHASITWNGDGWGVRDLGSHNGTAVNGDLIPAKTRRKLKAGDEVTFGQAAATWTLSDDGEPEPIAVAPDGRLVVGERGILVLPTAEEPLATIYRDAVGPWRAETNDGAQEIRDKTTLSVGEMTWTLRVPGERAPTRTSLNTQGVLRLRDAELRLVLGDGERGGSVEVKTEDHEFSFPLGMTVGVLSVLAEQRHAPGGGWVDREKLLTDLRISSNNLNVTVYRLRRQFADAGFTDAVQIVERVQRRLRLGTERITVLNGDPTRP